MSHPHEPTVDFHKLYEQREFHDDMKGGRLDKEKVIAARRLEIEYFQKMGGCTQRSQGRRPGALGLR